MDDSEYSLLIHNLTSTIGAANDEVSPHGSRKRGHPSRVPFAASASSSPPSERATKKAATSSSSLSTTKVMRIEAEMDELRLENEQVRDELAAVRDEFERLKEKSARQLGFLESENGQLKRAAAEKIERYYEEKKKWQAKLRAAEAATASASAAAAAAAASAGGLPAAMVPSAAVLSSTSNSNDKWKVKLEELEKSVAAKSAEVKTLSVANAELEHTVKQLEQQVRLARMDVDSANSGDASEQRDLRKRLQEVEASLRRKSRELERLEQKSQNLTLLQEENSALTTKVAAMQTAMDAAQALKTKCVVLTEEKLTWNAMFREICKSQAPTPATSSAPGGGGGARPGPFSSSPLSFSPGADGSAAAEADVTPVMALRLLSSSQQQAALLLKNQGDLEAAKNDMRRKLTRTEASLHESERAKADAIFRAETAEDKLRLAQQQVRLFDGEIKSLRSMLKTFDAEASIGRPEAAMALKLKDEVAVVVQEELDACRQQAQKFAARVGELEEQLAATVAEGIETKRLGERQRLELQGLQQASGLDFVPGRTRVLHLQQNPSSMASAAAGVALPSTIPMERLKALQAENKQLADALAAAQSTGGGGRGATHPTGQSVDHSIVTGAGASSSSSSSSSSSAAAASNATGSNAALHTSVMAGGADSSKLNLRLKEMFRERITSFREAVYLLTGYKVDLLFANEAGGGSSSHPRLRLRSMYAESPDDSLLFQWRGEALELMQTPFAEKLDHRMLENLRRCNSVPCFLSNITLELFESQTFQG